ncbi:MAG: hypothetical protein V4484_07195 [Pseudomonadota bacterium]
MRAIAVLLSLSVSLCLLAPVWAAPATPDLSTGPGFRATCASLPRQAAQLRGAQQRQAFAICRDVELVQHVATFIALAEKHGSGGIDSLSAAERLMLRAELTHVRDELRTVRLVLEKLKLGENAGLMLKPSSWQLDLNNDAEIKTWERYFFAIPRRGHSLFRLSMPSDDPDYYAREYQLDAAIRIDQSDIAWALCYHYFAESLMETIMSYSFSTANKIELTDAPGMQRANRLMVRGFQTSDLMRRAILAEKDDDHEWIANPQQNSSVFPLPLDAIDFKVWGTLLGHVIPLFEGKTLLVANPKAGGMLGNASKICPPGYGLSVTRFYDQPPRHPVEQLNLDYLATMCQRVDPAHQASGLFDFMVDYGNRAEHEQGAGMAFLRQMLWMN